MSSPKVSVITGYYNRVGSLRLTIDSIRSQTFGDFELYVFDDCSTDGTADVLRDLVREYDDDRIRVKIYPSNVGFVNGMIAAIAETRGEYIAVMGSGDWAAPTRLAKQVELLEKFPDIGLVGSYFHTVLEQENTKILNRIDMNDASLDRLLKKNGLSHGEVMFRREVYERAGGYRPAFYFSPDYDLWLRMIRLTKFATVREPLYERVVRFDGASYNPEKFARQARYAILAKRIARLNPEDGHRLYTLLEAKGPEALVSQNDRELQRRIVRGALRNILWGNPGTAIEVATNYVTAPLTATAVRLTAMMARTYAGRLLFGTLRMLFARSRAG